MPFDADQSVTSTGALLVVGGRIDTIRKAAALGLDVVLIQHKDHFVPESAALAKAVIIADYTNWAEAEPLLVAAHQVYQFTAAISLTEPGLEIVGRVNDLFGLAGYSYHVSHVLKNKLEMRRHLATVGGGAAAISVAAAEAVSEASLREFGRDHGFPFIVKPTDLTASLGVHKVDSAEQIPEVWQQIEALRARTDLLWGSFFTVGMHVIEEYLDGPEYSVETFSFDGRHVVVAVTEKLVSGSGFIELGHAQPARISDEAEAALIGCTETFLDAIGQRHGASHTEIKLTSGGPKVVEGHNRIGGDRIVDLLELAYGTDFELFTVAWPFRLIEALPERPKLVQAAATRFLTAPPGTVVEVTGVDEVRAEPDVFALDIAVAPGKVIQAGSNWDRCGQVIVTGENTDAVVQRAAELVSRIQIHVQPAEGERP